MNVLALRSSFPTSESSNNRLTKRLPFFKHGGRSTGAEGTPRRSWKPNAFRPWVLVTAISICWALIVVLHLLLIRSQNNDGLIFADNTSDLPLSRSFLYLYLPTIIAILLSIFWSWIDLQIKRLEPYYQLSKPDGATGKESLLLQYPFDFVPFVPFSAVKNRHWAVFWASTAIVVVTWGLVPVQAGIFASESITKTSNTTIALSTDFIPSDRQGSVISNRYSHSAHGIIWLNETLPPYMTRNYTLAPFRVKSVEKVQNMEIWTAPTQLYSVDLACEVPKLEGSNDTYVRWTTSWGCEQPIGDGGVAPDKLGFDTIGNNSFMGNQTIYEFKEFSAIYVGYYATDRSDWSLEDKRHCPQTANHTFMIAFTRNKKRDADPPQNATRLFCQPSYYTQNVTARIDARTKRPLGVDPTGPKSQLPSDMWNATLFEYSMNQGSLMREPRGDLPTRGWPSQVEQLSAMQISLSNSGTNVPDMVGFAIGATNHTLEDLLDPEALRSAFESAYRIILARSMVEILDQTFSKAQETTGHVSHVTGAIIMVPVFVYIVEGLLGFISICAIALLYISIKRKWNLHGDPATISSMMSLVADNPALLSDFSRLDCSTMDELKALLEEKKFQLLYNDQGNIISEVAEFDPANDTSPILSHPPTIEFQIPKPVRPHEFRSHVALPFVGLHIALAITLGVLWMKSQPQGIPRPSNKAIVRQIIENYIPTAIATLIEPVWVLINRLLCLLQPLEELRSGHAPAKRSLDVDYSSLPPQLVAFQALRSCHFKLAAVCTMALLANLLALSFAGMFEERAAEIEIITKYRAPLEANFVSMNGNISGREEPSGAYQGGLGLDQFLVAESHYSANTTLPPWTDKQFFYVPFTDQLSAEGSTGAQARTTAFGSTLSCTPIEAIDYTAEVFRWPLLFSVPSYQSNFSFTVTNDAGKRVTCSQFNVSTLTGPATNLGDNTVDCHTGAVAMEFVLSPQAASNITEDIAFCAQTAFLGWARDPGDVCLRNVTTQLNDSNSFFISCRSKLMVGEADVLVDNEGRVLKASMVSNSSDSSIVETHFTNDPGNLIQQAHQYFFQRRAPMWHNDSFASDFLNYFMLKNSNNSRLIDPTLPLPSFEDVQQRLDPVYSQLFSIWLGINKEKLLLPATQESAQSIDGARYEQQIRIFISKSLFIIAECILAIYAIVALIIYLYRPGRFLPRLPISIAAMIGLFAAGSAVHDMEGMSLLNKKERRKRLDELDHRYGYGTFVGADGRLHVGIEKDPLVEVAPVPGVIEKVQTGLSKRSRRF